MNQKAALQNSLNLLFAQIENAKVKEDTPKLLRLLSTRALLQLQLDKRNGSEELKSAAFQIHEFYNFFTPAQNTELRLCLLGLPHHAGQFINRMKDNNGKLLNPSSDIKDVVFATTYNLALLIDKGRSAKKESFLTIPSYRTNIALALLKKDLPKLRNQVRRDVGKLGSNLEGPSFNNPDHWAPIFSLLMKSAGKKVSIDLKLPDPWNNLL